MGNRPSLFAHYGRYDDVTHQRQDKGAARLVGR